MESEDVLRFLRKGLDEMRDFRVGSQTVAVEPEAKEHDSGIGKVAAFDAAERAIYEAFRWYCCESNADQKGCTKDCPRKQALDALKFGRALLLIRRPAGVF